jgi:hypothetical protein
LSEASARPSGRPAGMKPVHGVVALVLAVVWFGTLGFVLTHGSGDASSVNVYSELPPGFDAQLQAQGVKYQGLSSVDATTQQAVESLPSPADAGVTGAAPLVLRTATGAPGGGEIWVEFVDPTTYQVLRTVKYAASLSAATSSPSG